MKKVQSHNLSPQQLRDLQISQVNGEQDKIKANKDDSIEINAADAHLVHAEIEARQFNTQTGAKESTPIIQSFYPHEFDSMEKQNAFGGKSVRIVHTPEGYTVPNGGDKKSGGNGKEKALTAMNLAELQAKYKEVYGEDADPEAKKAELLAGIKDGLAKDEAQGNGDEA